ncbi:hypothetical protein HAZT_HAZT006813, partial [Hyalella azteca]
MLQQYNYSRIQQYNYSRIQQYNYSRIFTAVELLTYCYQQDDSRAHELLTYELRNWSKQTCLSLAAAVNHRSFIAQPCCQILLADLWLGGLRTRKNTNIKPCCQILLADLWLGGLRTRKNTNIKPCCQILLADLWLGGLRTRKNTNIK